MPALCLHFFSRCEFWPPSVMTYKLGEYSIWSVMRMKRIGVFQQASLFRKLQSELPVKMSATLSSKTSTAVIAIRTSYKTSQGSTIQSLWKQPSLVGSENPTVRSSIEVTGKTQTVSEVLGQDGLGIPLSTIFCDYDVILSSVSLVSRHPFSYFIIIFYFFSSNKDISPTGKISIIPTCTIYIFTLVYRHITVPLDGSRDLYRSDPTETRLQFESSLGTYQLRCSNEWMNYFTVFPVRLMAISTAPVDSTIHPTAGILHLSFPFCLP